MIYKSKFTGEQIDSYLDKIANNEVVGSSPIVDSEGENSAVLKGGDNQANGDFSIAEGIKSVAEGFASHAEGYYTLATNTSEHASGKYNVSIPKTTDNTTADATQFSIGIGTSDTDRKNAFEVKQNGDIYINGIGGFTGATSDSAKSVQEVINELVNKLNEITTND